MVLRIAPAPHHRGFTLVELLVVMVIILIISVVALPVVLPAFSHRQVSEAARLVQGCFNGARDQAISTNNPSGIRLLPDPSFSGIGGATTANGQPNPYAGILDPTQILAYNRIIPLEPAPEYSEGFVTVNTTPPPVPLLVAYPSGGLYPIFGAVPPLIAGNSPPNVLMVEESFYAPQTIPGAQLQPNPPTSWFWNIRVGDKVQISNAGPWYTVIGPMTVTPASGNSEMFVNVGPPGTSPTPLVRADANGSPYHPDFLFLVNGQDDNNNGWADEGWDGVDNNGNGVFDEPAEWQANMGYSSVTTTAGVVTSSPPEAEAWLGSLSTHGITNALYSIRRRPAPSSNAREIALPTQVVIDATTWGSTLERSRIPSSAFNQYTGYIDIVVNPDGTIVPTTIYSSPSTIGLASAFIHLWVCERKDLTTPVSLTAAPALPIGDFSSVFYQHVGTPTPYGGPRLSGEYAIMTVIGRTGRVATTPNPGFDDPAQPITQFFTPPPPFVAPPLAYDPGWPFVAAQQGAIGGN